jgi:hypothetical protein
MSRNHPHPKEAAPHLDDGIDGNWPRIKLEQMDSKFAAAMAREQRPALRPVQTRQQLLPSR